MRTIRTASTARAVVGLTTLCLAFAVGCENGDTPTTTDPPSSSSPGDAPAVGGAAPGDAPTTAEGVLDAMIAVYQNATTYADAGKGRLLAQVDTEQIDDGFPLAVTFERPNRLRINAYRTMVVSDGKQFHASLADLPDQVLVRPAPAKVGLKTIVSDPLLNQGLSRMFAGLPPQLGLLFDENPKEILLRNAAETSLAEEGEIAGRKCHRVKIAKSYGTDVFWIDQESYVLRRIDYAAGPLRQILAQGGSQVHSASLTADFVGAQIDGAVGENAFAFEIPEGAEQVESFVPRSPLQLLGKTTRPFKLRDATGAEITDESLRGKVVVLDFWATYCSPCAETLPMLQKVYQRYKDDARVVVLAVSVDDAKFEDAAVQAKLQEHGVSVPLVRDLDGAIESAFYNRSIPALVVIGADGVVEDFSVGVDASMPEELPKRIDRLLAGEHVYEETKKRLVPVGQVVEASPPQSFKLEPLWQCSGAGVVSPGAVLVVERADGTPRILFIDAMKAIVEVGPDGRAMKRHEPKIAEQELISALRTAVDDSGNRYFVAFSMIQGQQRLHLFDDAMERIRSYPEDALENPHPGIADVSLGDLDGDGGLEMVVGYWGEAGVQAVPLTGKRLWSNRSVANVLSTAIGPKDAKGARPVVCTDGQGSLAILDAAGGNVGKVSLPGLPLYGVACEDLEGDGQLEWCGLVVQKQGENLAVGFTLDGRESWRYTLPGGIFRQPVERFVAGRLQPAGPRHWLLPGPDGSVHILAADGTPLDKFNYGRTITGLATASIGKAPVLLISTPEGLDAWKIQ